MRIVVQLIVVTMTVTVALPAMAGVIFDNGNFSEGGSWTSDRQAGRSIAAGAFILEEGASTITDIHWWGRYIVSDTPQTEDDFDIQILADSAGVPGALIWESNVGDAGRTFSGVGTFEDVYAYSVDVPAIHLSAGTVYWLSVSNDTTIDQDDIWAWMSTTTGFPDNDGLTATYLNDSSEPWEAVNSERAFQLTNDNLVPEPAAATLLGFGLAIMAYGSRRRRTKARRLG